jgi:hypothetical protein
LTADFADVADEALTWIARTSSGVQIRAIREIRGQFRRLIRTMDMPRARQRLCVFAIDAADYSSLRSAVSGRVD